MTEAWIAGILGSAKAPPPMSVKAKSATTTTRTKTNTTGLSIPDHHLHRQTNADDLLIADLMPTDIWRYPVSGIALEDGLHAFWEIAFPGETINGAAADSTSTGSPRRMRTAISCPTPLTGAS